MTEEVKLHISLQVEGTNVKFRSYPTAFTDDLTNDVKGPVTGAFTASTAYTDVDLSNLTNDPGWARLENQSDTYTVIFGIRHGAEFYPITELPPNGFEVLKLSRFLNEVFDTGTGTATIASDVVFAVKAIGTNAAVKVEILER